MAIACSKQSIFLRSIGFTAQLYARAWAKPHSQENLSILENLVITWQYTDRRPSVRTAGKPIFNLAEDSSLGAQVQPDIAHPCCDQLTPVKTGYLLTSATWPYRGLGYRPIEVEYFLKLSADKLLVFNWLRLSRTNKILISNWPRTR